MNALAVIPARGGSKRIPRKNIRPFAGRPMIAHSIETALASGLFDRVVVSTDDEEIADVARTHGADVPFVRPPELANDQAGTSEVVAHAIQWLRARAETFDAVCCLYATAPLVQSGDLRRGAEALATGRWEYTFTATDFPATIFRSFQRHPGGGVEMFFPEKYDCRSQDLPVALHDAAQFYWARPDTWARADPVFTPRSFPVLLPRWRVQDVDTPEDWARAELIFQTLQAGVGGAVLS